MNKEEAKKILFTIYTTYPSYKMTGDQAKAKTEIWARVFQSIPAEKVLDATIKFISTSVEKDAPTPGQIMRIIQNESLNVEDGISAWGKVKKSLKNAIRNSQEEFDKLPDPARKAIGSPSVLKSWAMNSNFSKEEGYIKGQFLRDYKERVDISIAEKSKPGIALDTEDNKMEKIKNGKMRVL